MRKDILLITGLILMSTSCKNENPNEESSEVEVVKLIKSVESIDEFIPSLKKSYQIEKFDRKEDLVLRIENDSDNNMISQQEFSYNSVNEIESIIKIDSNFDTTAVIKYRYDEVKNIQLMDNYYDNKLELTYYFYRNEHGNNIAQAGYFIEGGVFDSISNEYDDNQRRIKQVEVSVDKYYTFEYNNLDDIVRKQYVDVTTNEIQSTVDYEYIYDDYNNWTEKIEKNGKGNTRRITKRKIEYYK